jgi:hypothetical protein
MLSSFAALSHLQNRMVWLWHLPLVFCVLLGAQAMRFEVSA